MWREKEYLICPVCKCVLREGKKKGGLKNHIMRSHSPNNFLNQSKMIVSAASNIHPAKSESTEVELVLYSKRATRVEKTHRCEECHAPNSAQWNYADSNRGTVYLCTGCKEIVRVRSFNIKEIDALNLSDTGGSFEGNKRRH